MTKRHLIIAIVLAGLVAGYFYKKKPNPITVDIYTVDLGEVKSTVSNTRVGTVKACRRAFLAPATGGQVANLHVKEGDQVKQNQLLLEVWNDDLKDQAKLQDAQVKANRANAEQACQLGANAEREATRISKLFNNNHIVSEEAVDSKVSIAKAKQAACKAARESITVSERSREVAQAAIQRTLVFAPFDGTIAEINAELGEYVTPSPPGIPTLPPIDLMDISCLYVSAPIDEVDAPQIKTGMTACVSLDAFAEKRCSGTVSRIAPYVLEKEKQARTVEVEVKLTDPKDLKELLPGYSADIEVLLTSKPQAIRIPAEAVMDNNRVLLVKEDGLLEERTFKPGLSNWNTVEVISGLNVGDKIVKSIGQEGVKAGAYIREKP
ncbi:efflux transporter, RND family, MFP subunit [Methyloglobulus morosus KoM1]|uniref:Efflux transporter, RND family, MFP subunit n=1 Tax=Methyloglobulus morosus KoM1 TaxID=1116472 RepID=V5BLF0_9GAMM|nr:efflux RND transporter periplasmic adaptor subunit [Methyloglobulus morosus]ESS68589.1 efflux transporter, RND family, MFP subunit [Methyloglobulus morosus KoM1]